MIEFNPSFKNEFYDYDSESRKFHINLSEEAYTCIENDRICFSMNDKTIPFDTFLNRVMLNFREDANSSVGTKLNFKNQMYLNELENEKLTGKVSIDKLCRVLLSIAKKDILNELMYDTDSKNNISEYDDDGRIRRTKYPSGSSRFQHKMRINKTLRDVLSNDDLCFENQYYNSIGVYLKALIEEYTRKTYVERERIYFKDTVDEIKKSIEKGTYLKIESGTSTYYAIPYRLMTDKISMYNYLACLSCKGTVNLKDTTPEMYEPASFRVARISECTCMNNTVRLKSILNKNRDILDEHILKHGIMFMRDDIVEVRVKFTEYGFREYCSRIHMRPEYCGVIYRFENGTCDIINTDDKISQSKQSSLDKHPFDSREYIFKCSERQAEYYFFSFAENITILSPDSLKCKFKKKYTEALIKY